MALDLGAVDALFDDGIYFELAGQVHPEGKRYRIPPPAADLGLWGRKAMVLRAELADLDGDELEAAVEQLEAKIGPPPVPDGMTAHEMFLGPELVAEMAADKVPDPAVERMANVVYARIIGGDRLALRVFQGDLDPNPTGPANRAQRRAAAKKVTPKKASGSQTTNTAAATTTRKAASGSGTRSRKTGAASAKASRGRKS